MLSFIHSFFLLLLVLPSRSFIKRDVHPITLNNRWPPAKKQQIEFSGIECNIYIQMTLHYLNMMQVNCYTMGTAMGEERAATKNKRSDVILTFVFRFFLQICILNRFITIIISSNSIRCIIMSQYPHENLSLSPQQSSTSDADEIVNTSTITDNRGVVCERPICHTH